jgi:hypothetical protein
MAGAAGRGAGPKVGRRWRRCAPDPEMVALRELHRDGGEVGVSRLSRGSGPP